MLNSRSNPVMKAILAALLFGTLTTGVFAKDLKVVAPESRRHVD